MLGQVFLLKIPVATSDQELVKDFLADRLGIYLPIDRQLIWQFINFNQKLTIDDVRQLQARLPQLSSKTSSSIFVLSNLDQAQLVTQNSLLKTLEQPPTGIFFLLLTNSLGNILDTLKSRCQVFDYSQHLTLVPDLLSFIEQLQVNLAEADSASRSAQIFISSFEASAKKLDCSLALYTGQVLTAWLFELDRRLHTVPIKINQADCLADFRLLQLLSQALAYLKASVGAKNVLTDLAYQTFPLLGFSSTSS